MGKNIDSIICIDKGIFNRALQITQTNSDILLDEKGKFYLIEQSIVDSIIEKLKVKIRFDEMDLSKYKDINLTRYEKLKEKYLSYSLANKRTDDKDKKIEIESEKLLSLMVDVYNEIDNIKQIPLYKEMIEKELNDIEKLELSENIKSYKVRFKNLVKDDATLDEYINLKIELDLIIKKTYEKNINSTVTDNKNIYLVKSNGKVSILTNENVNNFDFGYIYSACSIKNVYDNKTKNYVPFDNYDEETCTITINEDMPIGVYYVTYGEKSINPNYVKAVNLCGNGHISVFELDKTRMSCLDKINYAGLIDILIDNKGVNITKKDESFYNGFKVFIDNFEKLKNGEYSESNIITLFENHFNRVTSPKFLDINTLLENRLNKEDLLEIFECNIYFDFNIFRYKETSQIKIEDIEKILDEFDKKLYEYRSNRMLNMVYPGIETILNRLHKSSENRKQFAAYWKKLVCFDSYFIANDFKPDKIKSVKENIQSQTKIDSNYEIKNQGIEPMGFTFESVGGRSR